MLLDKNLLPRGNGGPIREVVEFPSLGISQTQLEAAQGSLQGMLSCSAGACSNGCY